MVQYNGPERLRMRLQEEWIRSIVRQELTRALADLAHASRNAPAAPHPGGPAALPMVGGLAVSTDLLAAACEGAIEKIKERTEHEHTRHGR